MCLKRDFEGLCFVNLVDFDMLYGHRQDIDGYAAALSYFDSRLPQITEQIRDDDLFIITADHGCDPGDDSTDHTREQTPFLIYKKGIKTGYMGEKKSFATVAATVVEFLGVDFKTNAQSVLKEIAK